MTKVKTTRYLHLRASVKWASVIPSGVSLKWPILCWCAVKKLLTSVKIIKEKAKALSVVYIFSVFPHCRCIAGRTFNPLKLCYLIPRISFSIFIGKLHGSQPLWMLCWSLWWCGHSNYKPLQAFYTFLNLQGYRCFSSFDFYYAEHWTRHVGHKYDES